MLIWSFNKLLALVRHSILLSLLFFLSILLSLITFTIFYNWYLPSARFERKIDFELFNSQHKSHNHHELISSVNLFEKNGQTLNHGQEYSIKLILDLPESDANFDLGTFGVTADMVDINGKRISSFKGMGTLEYKSFFLRCLTTLINFPNYLLGRFEQRQKISMLLKDNYVDNAYIPAYRIVLKIHDKLHFYSALLIVDAKFSGLKYLLHEWFYTSFVFIGSGLTSIIFLILVTIFFDLKSIFLGNNTTNSKTDSPRKTEKYALTGKLSSKEFPFNTISILDLKSYSPTIPNFNSFREYLKPKKHSID